MWFCVVSSSARAASGCVHVCNEQPCMYYPKDIASCVLSCAAVVSCLQDKKRGGIYEAPCYRVKSRKGFNYITSFALRTEDDKSKWILRGAALLCSID